MYRVLGDDQQEYGPVSAETLRQWIAEGRVNADTLVLPAGASQWVAIPSVPEFSGAFATAGLAGPPPLKPVEPGFYAVQPARTSGLAIASLVLGLLGFCGVTSFIGLILGIVALAIISQSHGRLGGKGLAVAGICVSSLFLLLLMILALAIPSFVKPDTIAQKDACINNLRQVDGAKEQWALENRKTAAAVPTWNDLVGPLKYIKEQPACPAGGTYTINAMAQRPTCSVPGHELP